MLHAAPHVPQFDASVVTSVSQPFARFPSQLPRPALHTTLHDPAEHVAEPPAYAGHALPHAPQFATSAFLFTSQPFDATPSQSAYPGWHWFTAQAPPKHVADACDSAHTLPHPPQWFLSPLVSTSHPFPALLSQLA